MRPILFILALLLTQAQLFGVTYHVHTSGSDGNSCATAQSSGSSAKLTVAAGVACLASGDTLRIHAGSYTISSDISSVPAGGGSFASATIIEAATGETVTLTRSTVGGVMWDFAASARNYIIIRGADTSRNMIWDGATTGSYGMYIADGHHIRVQNVEVKQFATQGIGIHRQTSNEALGAFCEILNVNSHNHTSTGDPSLHHGLYLGGSDNLVDGGEFHDNTGHAIQAYIDPSIGRGVPNRNTIRNIKAYNNSKTGIGLYHGSGNLAYNNLIYDNSEDGSRISGNTNKALNNTYYSNTGDAVWVVSGNSHQVINNIFYQNGGTVVDNGTGTIQTTNLTANPLFVSAPSNLNISAGSSAIDGGTSQSSIFTTDYAGTTRPAGLAWDIGAYEFSGSDSITLLSPNGGQTVVKNTSYTVTWGSVGSISAVDILYAADGVTFSTTLANATANDGTQAVTIPNAASVLAKIRVQDDADGTPVDTSDAAFTVTDAAGGTFTKIISENTTGVKIGDFGGVTDAYLEQVSPINPHDTALVYVGKFAESEHVHGLVRFDVSAIPPTATVTSVTLGLYLSEGVTATEQTFDLRRLLRTWVESLATWTLFSAGNSWTTGGGLGAATDRTDTAVAQIPEITVTPGYFTVTQSSGGLFDLVQDWIDGTTSNQGLHLERNGTGNDEASRAFTSSEGTNGQRPYLEVTYSTSTSTITVTDPLSGSMFMPSQMVPVRWSSQGVSGNIQILLSRSGNATPSFTETVTAAYPFSGVDFAWTVPSNGPSSSNCYLRVVSVNDGAVYGEVGPLRIGGRKTLMAQ